MSGGERGDRGSAPIRPLGGWFWLILMTLIGSSTPTAAKFAVPEIPFGVLALARFGVAGLCLWPAARGTLRSILREDGGRLLLAAAFCVPLNQTFFLNATRLSTTTHVGLFYATVPLVVLVLATLIGQERPGLGRLAGVLATVAGVAIVAVDGALHRRGPSAAGSPLGDLLLVGAVASWGAYLTISRPLVARHGAMPTLAATFLVGAAMMAPIAAATFPGVGVLAAASPSAWRGLAYMAIVCSVVGLSAQNLALRSFEASQVATVSNVSNLLTVLWGVVLLGEPLTPALGLGAILTIGGVLWANRPPARRPSGPAAGPDDRLVDGAPHPAQALARPSIRTNTAFEG